MVLIKIMVQVSSTSFFFIYRTSSGVSLVERDIMTVIVFEIGIGRDQKKNRRCHYFRGVTGFR